MGVGLCKVDLGNSLFWLIFVGKPSMTQNESKKTRRNSMFVESRHSNSISMPCHQFILQTRDEKSHFHFSHTNRPETVGPQWGATKGEPNNRYILIWPWLHYVPLQFILQNWHIWEAKEFVGDIQQKMWIEKQLIQKKIMENTSLFCTKCISYIYVTVWKLWRLSKLQCR